MNSGAVVQVGTGTFRIRPHAGPIVPQGNPWEPTIIAYNLGDETYRPTERPAHINVSIVNSAGAAQTLDFPPLPDQPGGYHRLDRALGQSVVWLARGVSGRFRTGADCRRWPLTQPFADTAAAKYPVEVIVGAFQWGRAVARSGEIDRTGDTLVLVAPPSVRLTTEQPVRSMSVRRRGDFHPRFVVSILQFIYARDLTRSPRGTRYLSSNPKPP